MKLRILMIETSGFGGLAYYTYCLCNQLSILSDIDVTLLTHTEYELRHYKSNYKVIQKNLIGVSYFSAILTLLGIVKKTRPDIIHVQSFLTARKDWLLFIMARLFRISLLYTAHNVSPHDEEEREAFGMRFAFRMICSYSKAIITHSETNRKAICRLYGLKDKDINIIKHGNYLLQARDVKRFNNNEAKKMLGLDPDNEVVLFFGAVREYKGIIDLLQAMKGLFDKHPKLRLLIAGKARENIRSRIESFIRENHLQKTILFHNKYIGLKEFGLYFDASDVVALPYKHSYGSGALQTAMAFSKPIILTDLPFFREIVVEKGNGLFFRYGQTESLSEKIVDFFSLPKEKRVLMAKASLSIAKEKFDWGPIAEQTLFVYKQIAT